jgi:hypothetical protein
MLIVQNQFRLFQLFHLSINGFNSFKIYSVKPMKLICLNLEIKAYTFIFNNFNI